VSAVIAARVERIVAGGLGLVRVDGQVMLVAGVVPGDEVELRGAGSVRGAQRATVVRIARPSPDRRAPECPIVDACGGCPLMHASAGAQRHAKEGILREALGRDAFISPIVTGDASLAYRDRATLRWSRGRLGYHRSGTREVVDVVACPILSADLAPAVDLLRSLLPDLGRSGTARAVRAGPGKIALSISPDGDPTAALFRAVEAAVACGRLRGAVVVSAGGGSRARIGDPTGEVVGGDGEPIAIDPDGFAQAGAALVPRLASNLIARIPASASVLELHAGAGTWSVAIARRAGSLVCVEAEERAAKRLAENCAARGLSNVRVRTETAEAALATGGKRPDVVVLDPPRTGAKEITAALAKLRSPTLLYVSCDPATLGRDLRALVTGGYRLVDVQPYDFMPHSAQVEALAALELQ